MKFLTLRRGNSERPASAPNEFEESKLWPSYYEFVRNTIG